MDMAQFPENCQDHETEGDRIRGNGKKKTKPIKYKP